WRRRTWCRWRPGNVVPAPAGDKAGAEEARDRSGQTPLHHVTTRHPLCDDLLELRAESPLALWLLRQRGVLVNVFPGIAGHGRPCGAALRRHDPERMIDREPEA